MSASASQRREDGEKSQAFNSIPSGTEVIERLYPEGFFTGPANLIKCRVKASDQARGRGDTLKVTCTDPGTLSRNDLKPQTADTKGTYIQGKVG